MIQFVDFPNQLTVDEILEFAQARQLSRALDLIFKAIDANLAGDEESHD